MKRSIVVFLLLFGSVPAVFAQSCESLEAFLWMEGEWVAQGKTYTTYESWHQVSPYTMEGEGRVVTKETGEQRSTESIRLLYMAGDIFMLPKAGHNTLPTPFKLGHCVDDRAVFENKAHDFPKQLMYQRVGDDSLYVRVSDGGEKGFTLRFGRK